MGEIGNVIKTNSIASLLPFSFDNTYLWLNHFVSDFGDL
jgi:hypothetical protein